MNRQPNFTFEEVYNTQTDYDENEFFNQQTNEQFLEEESINKIFRKLPHTYDRPKFSL
jgi:hypothetical protein